MSKLIISTSYGSKKLAACPDLLASQLDSKRPSATTRTTALTSTPMQHTGLLPNASEDDPRHRKFRVRRPFLAQAEPNARRLMR